jgi:uncharacterized protein (TIGR02271 family)
MRKNEDRPKGQEDHPGGFFGGGAAGAAAGAAIGSMAGPAGTVAGAAIGGLGGAVGGESLASSMSDEEEGYWRENFRSRPYAGDDTSYEDFAPAYRTGYAASERYGKEGRSFDEVEGDLREVYDKDETTHLDWDSVRDAARDAYERSLTLREERLRAKKDRVDTGEVKLRKEVVTRNESFEVPVEREEVVVERRAVSQGDVSSGDISEEKNEEVARIPVSEEKVRVEKETVPTEEISLKKQTVRDSERVSGTVRKEEARIEKTGNVNVRDSGQGSSGQNNRR